MAQRDKKILITGVPGSGKTTLVVKLADRLKNLRPAGFYTEEIREGGVRKGFKLQSFAGQTGLLSHVDIKTPNRVGKYGVDVLGFERFLEDIPFNDPATGLIIVDEIGKMECLSSKFRNLVTEILDSAKLVIATIALKGSSFIAEIRAKPGVRLFEITERNRNILLDEIIAMLNPEV